MVRSMTGLMRCFTTISNSSRYRVRLVYLEVIQCRDRDLASQVRRAVSSIALNAAEARGNAGGNTRVRLESALGSLYEAQAGIRLAIAWGYFSQVAANEVLAPMNCLGGRIFGLVRKYRADEDILPTPLLAIVNLDLLATASVDGGVCSKCAHHPTTEAIHETAAATNSQVPIEFDQNLAGSPPARRDSHRAPLAANHNLTSSAEIIASYKRSIRVE